MDRLRTYLFKPTIFTKDSTSVFVSSPTLNQISEIGENYYNFFLTFATFNFSNMFDFARSFTNLEINEDDSDYENAVSNSWIRDQLCGAISFFINENVAYVHDNQSFCVESGVIIRESNYHEFASIVRELNALEEKKEKSFRNDISRKKHERYEKLRKKYANKDNNSLELKDICSILCYAEGNGINVFNVGELTIYHLYEHFERLNMKENYLTTHQIYTNGLLDDPSKLKSWMVRTKY